MSLRTQAISYHVEPNYADSVSSQLSAATLDALKEFYGERDSRQKQFEDLKAQAETDFSTKPLSMEAFAEDWNASQFWVSRFLPSLEPVFGHFIRLTILAVQRRDSNDTCQAATRRRHR